VPPTRGAIDAVRFVSNHSSGRLGCRIATEALGRGARVTLVAGPRSATPDAEALPQEQRGRLHVVPVVTVKDVMEFLERELFSSTRPDAVVHAMAVLDYVPETPGEEKTPSGRSAWQITLVKTPKVVRYIRKWAPDVFLVQFKLEVGTTEGQLREVAIASMWRNRADLVVANDMTSIRDEQHPALIIAPDGTVLARPSTKSEVAEQICNILAEKLAPHTGAAEA